MGCPTVYNEKADDFFERYEAIDAKDIFSVLDRWVPANARVLELGCGSGRDARHMKEKGAVVTATDGSPALLALARKKEARQKINGTPVDWQPLTLPVEGVEPDFLKADGKGWDVVFTSGMLQHLDDNELYQTASDIDRWSNEKTTLIVLVPLNHPDAKAREIHERDVLDYVTLFERMGFREAFREIKGDVGSPGFHCRWATLVFLRADKSDEATKRFRTIIDNDLKNATYKLALLRSLCAINRSMPRAVRFENGRAVLPISLILEKWIEYYWHLAGGKQMPLQRAYTETQTGEMTDIAFLNELNKVRLLYGNNWAGFNQTLAQGSDELNVQIAVSNLFGKVNATLKEGPLKHIQDPTKAKIFVPCGKARSIRAFDRLSIREKFGEFSFPAELWQELNHIAPWLEDAIILEWARVSARFELSATKRNSKPLSLAEIVERMMPKDDERDTTQARNLFLDEITHRSLRCVWTRHKLQTDTLAVDHMLPWARFHTNDLWNLMPALNSVNSAKSDRIPSADCFYAARTEIQKTWTLLEHAWSGRFRAEAEIALLKPSQTLPTADWTSPLFDALLIVADSGARQTQANRYP